jgi:DNA-binding MarR family transcriptional regulator
MEEAYATVDDIPTDELLKLENQLCFPLYVCSKEVVRRYTPFLDKIGLTYTQYLVMMALWEYGSMSVGEMGERLYLDSGTLTPLLKKMEVKGLLVRRRSGADARRVEVELTEEGRALKESARDVPLSMGGCVTVDPNEAAELVRLLRKVMDSVRDSY